MPPVQHSSSSRSAHKDSDQIPVGNMYVLGDYHFALERTSIPGSTNDKIEAICTKINESKSARKSIQVPSTYQFSGYYVEANGTTADVYAVVGVPKGEGSEIISSEINQPLERVAATAGLQVFKQSGPVVSTNGTVYAVSWKGSDDNPGSSSWGTWSFASATNGAYVVKKHDSYDYNETVWLINRYIYQDKTVYYTSNGFYRDAHGGINIPFGAKQSLSVKEVCWHVIYGEIAPPEYETKQVIVGRFAINIEDAGGVGPDAEGGDDPDDPDDGWDDPDDYYDDDYDDYEDTEEYDDELYLELDKWDGEPGESFTATITGHNGESVVVSVQPNDATEEILTYRLYAPASKDAPLTYTFTTDESWMADGIYSRAFLITATTDETARTANDGFTLYVEEPDMLTVDTDMDDGQPGETITAYVGGHSGHTFSAVVTNAVGDIVATFSQVVPQSQYSDVELPIVLNEAWFSSNSSSETLIITATTDDKRQASAVFKMVLEPLTVSLDVDKYMAEVGEEVTWSMEAEGGNGNYQYNFFIFLDGELVRDGRWQFDNFLTYTPHSPGTYTVEGYLKDSRLSQNVKAPEDGEVIVEGEPEPEPEPEPDEITRTLYITVTGALSGRHNDPGKDPSYSYLPAEKSTIADYGCGGDGGHGGGGGAGASNVVVYKFATDKADNKEITAITKRPGFGSGGGKGGKGGDGCILIYY